MPFSRSCESASFICWVSSSLPFFIAQAYFSTANGFGAMESSGFLLTKYFAGEESMSTTSTFPCLSASMASAPLLYFSTVAPSTPSA